MCWGAGDRGQLGNNAAQDSATPVTTVGLSGIEGISPGTRHACAQAPGGTLCWGANEFGQLGNDVVGDMSTSPVVPNAGGFDGQQSTDLYSGAEHVCVTYNVDGRVYCWGLNDSGQLGNGTLGGTAGPAPVGP
jgi:alpha-tubulin suppressor-like RCC1 family protein